MGGSDGIYLLHRLKLDGGAPPPALRAAPYLPLNPIPIMLDFYHRLWQTFLACWRRALDSSFAWIPAMRHRYVAVENMDHEAATQVCLLCRKRPREVVQFPCGCWIMCKPCARRLHINYWAPFGRGWRRVQATFRVAEAAPAFRCGLCRALSWPAQRRTIVTPQLLKRWAKRRSAEADPPAAERQVDAQVADDASSTDDGQKCIVCLVNERSTVQFPCGHWALCAGCALKQHEADVESERVSRGHAHTYRVQDYHAFPCPKCDALAWPAALFHG